MSVGFLSQPGQPAQGLLNESMLKAAIVAKMEVI